MARYKTYEECSDCGTRLEFSYTFKTYICRKCNKVFDAEDIE